MAFSLRHRSKKHDLAMLYSMSDHHIDLFVCIHPFSHDQTQDKMVFVATNDGTSSATESDRRSPTSAPSEVREPFLFSRVF